MMQVQFHFPSRPLPKTRLDHTYVFPSDEEVFILNSFYRVGEFVSDKLQGLWVGDMDFVRVKLEAMLFDLSEPRARRALTRSRQTGDSISRPADCRICPPESPSRHPSRTFHLRCRPLTPSSRRPP